MDAVLHTYTNKQLRKMAADKNQSAKMRDTAQTIIEYRTASYNKQSFNKFLAESSDRTLVDYMHKFPQLESYCNLAYYELLSRGYFENELNKKMERVS